jgi:dienelactone hydrolase
MDGADHPRREAAVQLREPQVSRRALLPMLTVVLGLLIPILSAFSDEQAPPGTVISVRPVGTARPVQIKSICAPLFEGYSMPPVRHAVDSYLMRFTSRDADGSLAEVVAMVFVPQFAVSVARPVLVFGSGTTGLGDDCAPSLEEAEKRYFGRYRENMLAYAGMGFIVILPDYIGFDDPSRPQRYFSKIAEGHVMLDAARAVFRYLAGSAHVVTPLPVVFAAGYSQGGHAAFAAADMRPSYAPEIPLAGVIGFGSTNDVEALLREGTCYAPLIFYTYEVLYGRSEIDPAAYLQERWAKTLEADVNRMCVDSFQKYYGFDGKRVYRPEFHDALYGLRLTESYPSLAARLAENKTGLTGHRLPALIVQGGTDFIVTSATQSLFVAALRAAGSTVTYREYKGVPHKGTRQAGFAESIEWMEGVARGDAPRAQ